MAKTKAMESVSNDTHRKQGKRLPTDVDTVHPQYQDVQLETVKAEIHQMLASTKSFTTGSDREKHLMQEMCAKIRIAKFLFLIALNRYGLDYRESGLNLIDMAHAGAKRAQMLGFERLYESIARHVADMEDAKAQKKSEQ